MASGEFSIRPATEGDALALAAIYAPYVRETAVSFDYEAPGPDEFRARVARARDDGYPFLVAEGQGRVTAYAYLHGFVGREAYRFNAETTIYLDRDLRGRGIGRALYGALEDAARDRGILALEACIGLPRVPDDPYLSWASVRFHEALGYREVGRFEACGRKFGRWYDMVWMEKRLAEPF